MERARSSRRAGFSTRGMFLILTPVAALPVVAWLLASEVNWSAEETGPLMHVVQRGDFVHEITERGDIESASNVEIRCEVQSRGQGGTTILWIIPEGTYVQPGDKLVTLDSSSLEDELRQQQIVCNNSKAAVIQAENTLETAKIAKKEYLEGAFTLAENEIKRKKFVASEAKRQAEQTLEYSKGLARKGYVTDLRVETDKIAVEKAKLDYESAELELKVLREFTKDKMIMQLDSDIKTAEAQSGVGASQPQDRRQQARAGPEAGRQLHDHGHGARPGRLRQRDGPPRRQRDHHRGRRHGPRAPGDHPSARSQADAGQGQDQRGEDRAGPTGHAGDDPHGRLHRHEARGRGRAGQRVSGAVGLVGRQHQGIRNVHQDPRFAHEPEAGPDRRSPHPGRTHSQRAAGAGPGRLRARRARTTASCATAPAGEPRRSKSARPTTNSSSSARGSKRAKPSSSARSPIATRSTCPK